jgi:hypothetical protein
MSEAHQASWKDEFNRLEAIEEESCLKCAHFRLQEAKTNKVKTDDREQTNAKATQRRAVHKKLAEHLAEVLAAENPPPGHEFLTIKDLLGKALPTEFNDDALEEKVVEPNLLEQGIVEPAAKDCRKLVVGRVPIHLRLNLKAIEVGDFILFRYNDAPEAKDDCSGADDDDDDDDHLGVALILKTPSEGDEFNIHWLGHVNYKKPDHALAGAYKKSWVQPASRKNGRSIPSKMYFKSTKTHALHYAFTEDINIHPAMIIGHCKKLKKDGGLPLKMKRLVCAVPNLPHKMKTCQVLGSKCDCITGK